MPPLSVVVEGGIDDTSAPIVLGGFLEVPVLREPPDEGLVEGGRIAWDADGARPTFFQVTLETQGWASDRVWRILASGDTTEVTLPDLAAVGGLPEPPAGPLVTSIWAVRIDTVAFDEFTYAHLRQRYWDAWSAGTFLVSLR